jgi:hypothetical protein
VQVFLGDPERRVVCQKLVIRFPSKIQCTPCLLDLTLGAGGRPGMFTSQYEDEPHRRAVRRILSTSPRIWSRCPLLRVHEADAVAIADAEVVSSRCVCPPSLWYVSKSRP